MVKKSFRVVGDIAFVLLAIVGILMLLRLAPEAGRRIQADSTLVESFTATIVNTDFKFTGKLPDFNTVVQAGPVVMDFNDIKLWNECRDKDGKEVDLTVKWWNKNGEHVSYEIRGIDIKE